MSISNFKLGKKYRIYGGEIYTELENDIDVPTSYIKVVFNNGSFTEFKNGYFDIYREYGFDNVEIFDNSNSENNYLADAGKVHGTDINIYYIEFVYDYIQSSAVKDPCEVLYPIADLISQTPLVAVYRTYNARWVSLPIPSDYSASSSTLVDSARNTKGEVVGSVIASDIAKIEMKWNFLTVDEYKTMAQLFEIKYNGNFFNAVAFYDVIKGGFNGNYNANPTNSSGNNPCKMFYCGDRKVTFAKMVLNDDGTPKGYSNVALNLIDTGKYYGE